MSLGLSFHQVLCNFFFYNDAQGPTKKKSKPYKKANLFVDDIK